MNTITRSLSRITEFVEDFEGIEASVCKSTPDAQLYGPLFRRLFFTGESVWAEAGRIEINQIYAIALFDLTLLL